MMLGLGISVAAKLVVAKMLSANLPQKTSAGTDEYETRK